MTLAWSPSSSLGVVGYRINYGTASGSYSSSQDAGNVTTATICCLEPSRVYYFAAQAYLANGELSPFSEEISFRTQQGENTPPYFDDLGDTSITTDGTQRNIVISGILSGVSDENQPLTVTAKSSRTDLLPNPVVTYSSPNSSGTFRIAPIPYAEGIVTITITVNDGQSVNNTLSRSFNLTLKSPNTPPTFSPIGDTSITSDGTQRDLPVTGIQAGAAGENQTLTLIARSSRPDLVPNPTVSYTSPQSTASVRIAPVVGVSGVATITVTADDGQAGNNTFSRTFNVTVAKQANTPPTFSPIGDTSITTDGTKRDLPVTGIQTGATGEPQTLTLIARSSRPDLLPNPTVSYTSPQSTASVRIAPVFGASGVATITVTADDGQADNNTFSRSFKVTLNAGNLPPRLDAIADLTLPEDSSPRALVLTGISTGSAQEIQPLTVTATSSLPSLLPHPVVTYRSPDATASISIAPIANRSGVATITVTVSDGQPLNQEITQTFKVTVYPLNDPPQLDEVADVTLYANSEAVSISLTGINSGATNELQKLTISAVSSSPSLLPDPVVTYTSPSSQGLLTLAPVATRSGSATITLTVSDGQNINSEVTRTFNVVVLAVGPASHYFEAESAEIAAPMETAAINSASHGSAAFSRVAEQGALTFKVPVQQTGAYYVWGRVLSTSSSSDSFYLGVDQGPEVIFHTAQQQWADEWQWVQLMDWTLTDGQPRGTPRLLQLKQGAHQITIRSRESFTFLDAFFLSTDPAAVPPSASPASMQVSHVPFPLQASRVGTIEDGCQVTLSSGEFTMTGLGELAADVSSNDSFLFVNQPLYGNGGITVQLDPIAPLATNSFVGVMIREDLGSRSTYAAVGITHGEQIKCRMRSQAGAAPSSTDLPSGSGSRWFHLRRVDGTINAYGSPNGFSWTLIHSAEITLGTPVQIGIVVASGHAQSLYTMKFSDMNIIDGL